MAWPAPPSGETQWRIGFLSLARHGKSLVLGPLIDTLNDQGAFASNSANQPLSAVSEANADDDEANFELSLFDLDDDDVHLVVTGSSPATYAALEHRDRNGVKLTKPVV